MRSYYERSQEVATDEKDRYFLYLYGLVGDGDGSDLAFLKGLFDQEMFLVNPRDAEQYSNCQRLRDDFGLPFDQNWPVSLLEFMIHMSFLADYRWPGEELGPKIWFDEMLKVTNLLPIKKSQNGKTTEFGEICFEILNRRRPLFEIENFEKLTFFAEMEAYFARNFSSL